MLPNELIRLKELGQSITILTAWDSISAEIVETSGVDALLVGDSLAMFVHGHATTLPITLEQMLHHVQAVERGLKKPVEKQPLIICDLPFLSYQCGSEKAMEAAGYILKNSNAAAVKLEGAEPETLEVIDRLVRNGIPVMGHLGLTPQSVHKLGYRQQCKQEIECEKLINQSHQLEKVGCFSMVLEHIPSDIANKISKIQTIPVIGIGAGADCDGQIRVTADLLGLTAKQPPFTNPLIEGRKLFSDALTRWVESQQQ